MRPDTDLIVPASRGRFAVSMVRAAAAAVMLLPGAAVARTTATLSPVADSTMYSESGGLSNGAGAYMFAGRTNNSSSATIRRALVRFDLSGIPPGSTITSATLSLYMSRTQSLTQSVSIHRATSGWGEGASDAASQEGSGTTAAANDATWTHRFFNTTTWTAAGGDFVASASASVNVVGGGSYSWTGAGVLADVQGWYANGATNFGWVIRGNESAVQTTKRFGTRENTDPSQRPVLTIVYTPPTTTGRCCMPDSTCTETTNVACASAGGTFGGTGTTCAGCTCPGPTGACCATSGACSNLTYCQCVASGGVYKGPGTSCATTYCSPQLTPYMDALPVPAVQAPTTVFADHDHYVINIVEATATLHNQLPPTKVWAYNGQYPGRTIQAQKGRPVSVNWVNDLHNTAADEPTLRSNHYLPVDTCLHGVNPQDLRPRTVTHLHGGKVDPFSDGPPDQGFPPGFSSGIYWYPNDQRAATLWYHDHAAGLTRLNVYMGLAGFYLIHDPAEDALQLPSGAYDIPLVIQDRSFNADGTLRYTGVSGAQEEFFGDKILVNGKVWPYMITAQTKYRFRLLNGSNSRTYTLSLVPTGNFQVSWWQIATEQGLMAAPLQLGPFGPGSITLQPGERADIVIDFATVPGFNGVYLRNSAPAPFPGNPGIGVVPDVMLFYAGFSSVFAPPLPGTLATVTPLPEAGASATRDLRLRLSGTPICGHPTWLINDLLWDDITDFVALGTTEVWRITNQSAVTHPFHIHLASFQVLDRQAFTLVGGNPVPTGPVIARGATEAGWKDTVQCPPNQITRVIAKFDGSTGLYPYHCHLLEHEDHEMMRQFQVLCDPVQYLGTTADVDIDAGQTAHFQILATGVPVFYQWYKGSVALQNGPTPTGSVISGAQTDHLVITNAQAGAHNTDESSCYRCLISNACTPGGGIFTDCIALHVYGVCVGDVNGDSVINTADLVIQLGSFGNPVSPGTSGDMNGDGLVNTNDLVILLGRFGFGC